MEPYKTPEADLTTSSKPEFRPVKAVLLGLCITILLTNIVGIIESLIFSKLVGVDIQIQGALESAISNSILFMLTDILLSALVLYFAGTVVGKNVPGKEMIYSLIVSLITLAIFIPLLLSSNSFSLYPVWYNVISIISVPLMVYFGAKPNVKNQTA